MSMNIKQIADPLGYLALPSSGKGAGVLVLHAWWGLTDVIRETCDRLAAQGFVAYAPDLYRGELATTIEDAERLSSQLDTNTARRKADIDHAVNTLWSHTQTRQNGGLHVIGFSLGAAYALQLSGEQPERVRSVVLFYGTGGGAFMHATATYLGHFAEHDPYEPAESVAWLADALKSAGRSATFHHYSGVGHWFCERDRADAYNEEAAALAWARTIEFLKST